MSLNHYQLIRPKRGGVEAQIYYNTLVATVDNPDDENTKIANLAGDFSKHLKGISPVSALEALHVVGRFIVTAESATAADQKLIKFD